MHAISAALRQSGPVGRGIGLMLVAIVLFTLMDATAKGLTERYPTAMIVWARMAGQLFWVLILLRGRVLRHIRTAYPVFHLARAVTQLGASAFFFTSLAYIGLAEATSLADLSPVLILLGAALFLGEPLGPRRIFGILATLIGALIVIRPGAGVFTPAALLPLMGAVCYAANALITRWIGPQESLWTAMVLTGVIGTALTTLPLPFVWTAIAVADLPAFILIGMLGTTAQVCIIRSFTLAEASVVAPFTYLGIVFATLWGILFFDNYPDLWTVTGALVIVGAGLYVWHRETRAAKA